MSRQPYSKAEFTKLVNQGEARIGFKFFITPANFEPIAPVAKKTMNQSVFMVKPALVSHNEECRCDTCINVKLDEMVKAADQRLIDMKKAFGQEDVVASDVKIPEITIIAPVIEANPYTEVYEKAVDNISTIKIYKGSNQ